MPYDPLPLPPPATPASPQKPSVGGALGGLASLIPLLALASKQGGRDGMAGFLQGYQHAKVAKEAQQAEKGQQQFQNARLTAQDARQGVQEQNTERYRQAQIADAERQQRLGFLEKFQGGLGNLESPAQVDAYINALSGTAHGFGVEPGALQAMRPAPTALQKKAAEKKLAALKSQYGDKWMQMGGQFVHDLSNGEKAVPFAKVLEYAGMTPDASAPPIPEKPNPVNAGSFEDYVIRYAKDHGKTPDALTTKDIQAARKEYGQADDRGLAPPITINLPGMSPEEKVLAAAKAIREGRMAPSQLTTFFAGMGQNSEAKLRDAVMAQILREDPAFSFAGSESQYQFGKSTGVQTTVRFIDNISKTMPILEEANRVFRRSGVRSINAILKSGKSQFGSVDVAKFDMARTILADEFAKIMQGGGTGNGTSDAKLKQANDLLAGDLTADQFQAVIDTAKELMTTRRGTLTQGTFMDNAPRVPATAPGPNPFRR